MNKFDKIKEAYESIVIKYKDAPVTKDAMENIHTDLMLKLDCCDKIICDATINCIDVLNDGVILAQIVYDTKISGTYSFCILPFGNEKNFWRHTNRFSK